jgi:beta-lactamase class A
MRRFIVLVPFLFPAVAVHSQTLLQQRITILAKEAKGIVSVSCSLPGTNLDCNINAHGHQPMQSAFKLPLALAVLHAVEQGQLSLDQQVSFLPSDVYKGTFSPLQDAHPNANVDVPLRELLELSVGRSDNTATDILLRLMGGTEPVQRYLDTLGLQGIEI